MGATAVEMTVNADADATDDAEGARLRLAAQRLLGVLGRPDAESLTPADTADLALLFPPHESNGDGLVPASMTDDAELKAAIAELQAQRPGVFWFDGMLTLPEVKQVLSASTVFVCPSVYEPLGIVNLEAMACGAAVVASDVGGIPEVVNNGETGLLVHYEGLLDVG